MLLLLAVPTNGKPTFPSLVHGAEPTTWAETTHLYANFSHFLKQVDCLAPLPNFSARIDTSCVAVPVQHDAISSHVLQQVDSFAPSVMPADRRKYKSINQLSAYQRRRDPLQTTPFVPQSITRTSITRTGPTWGKVYVFVRIHYQAMSIGRRCTNEKPLLPYRNSHPTSR